MFKAIQIGNRVILQTRKLIIWQLYQERMGSGWLFRQRQMEDMLSVKPGVALIHVPKSLSIKFVDRFGFFIGKLFPISKKWKSVKPWSRNVITIYSTLQEK